MLIADLADITTALGCPRLLTAITECPTLTQSLLGIFATVLATKYHIITLRELIILIITPHTSESKIRRSKDRYRPDLEIEGTQEVLNLSVNQES